MTLRNRRPGGHRCVVATIQFTAGPASGREAAQALARAAVAAATAPSLVPGQPWRWRINGDTADLYAEGDGWAVAVSCGAALHYACTALAGAEMAVEAIRCPDPARPNLLARLRIVGTVGPNPVAVRRHRAIALRSAEPPMPDGTPVPGPALRDLCAAAEAEGAHLRPAADGRSALLYTDADTTVDRLATGAALSAVLLTGTIHRLSVAADTAAVPTHALIVRFDAPAGLPEPG